MHRARNTSRMPVGLSPLNISRIVAGILSALWAMSGLANNYVTLAAMGPSGGVIIAVLANIFLTAGSSLALVNARIWRPALLVALACVTADRLAGSFGSGAAFEQAASATIVFLAIGSIALFGGSIRPSGS